MVYEVGDIVKLKKPHPCGSHNPSTNCTNPGRNLPVHDDSENWEQSDVFLVIQGSLVQLNGSTSSRGLKGG